MTIGRHDIGPDHPVYIVAELSGNHGGELARALEIVDAAAAAGADAVKVQTYTADSLTLDVDAPPFVVEGGTAWDTRTLHDVYADAAMPWEWQPVLAARARELGLDCFSSPFDDAAVAFLEALDVPAYKIASFELVDIPLIERVARTGKPVIISAGMADRAEIEAAVDAVRRAGGEQVVVLKCTSSYPAPPESMNLRSIPAWADAFGVPVGLSDHSLDVAVPVAAVALGACVVEKHLTLRRSDGGPDAKLPWSRTSSRRWSPQCARPSARSDRWCGKPTTPIVRCVATGARCSQWPTLPRASRSLPRTYGRSVLPTGSHPRACPTCSGAGRTARSRHAAQRRPRRLNRPVCRSLQPTSFASASTTVS